MQQINVSKGTVVSARDKHSFQQIWLKYDPKGDGFISSEHIILFLKDLRKFEQLQRKNGMYGYRFKALLPVKWLLSFFIAGSDLAVGADASDFKYVHGQGSCADICTQAGLACDMDPLFIQKVFTNQPQT